MTNFAPNNMVISTGQRATFGSAYTLDGVGNRTQVDLNEPMMPSYNAETVNYTYTSGNILATADGATYTHDANGNRSQKATSVGTTYYTYDSLNRLTQTSTSSRQIQYIYNGLGQRIGKIDNGVQTNYLIDPNGILPQVLAETDASDNLISFYVYDGAGLVAKITPDNKYYFYHYDGLGSTIAITDNNGQVMNTYCYSPEGLVGAQETIPNPFTYVGRFGVMAEGNGLYKMGVRYYDPETGRFINKDPIGYAAELNLFTYTENNPVNYIDPEGLSYITYDEKTHSLKFYNKCGELVGSWIASNRAGYRDAKGRWQWKPTPWKLGRNDWSHYNSHPGLDVNSKFGTQGVHVFDIGDKGARGVGIHAGRKDKLGWKHATEGCIRTTEDAMKALNKLHRDDPIEYLYYTK
jgi:RHS repeat-associated protein